MDRLHVRLTTLGVAALLAVAAGLFGWRATTRDVTRPPPAAAAGEPAATAPPSAAELFDRHCGGCHTADDLRAGLGGAPDPAARRRELEKFLTGHGTATADEDRAILDDLFRLPRQATRTRGRNPAPPQPPVRNAADPAPVDAGSVPAHQPRDRRRGN